MKYLIGQRVFLGSDEIGIINPEPIKHEWKNGEKGWWVYSPVKGFTSYYDNRNIKPLPSGQL